MRLAPPGAPVHIHAAEQTREVDDCFAWSRMRPVEWLLTQAQVDARWCIVHATHMTEKEIVALAGSGAIAGLAPTTEADLGDGTFPGAAYQAAGGRFGVGSDSNTIIDPFAELRQLEWSQRTRLRRRNVLGGGGRPHARRLALDAAASAGAQALARNDRCHRSGPARRPRGARRDRPRAPEPGARGRARRGDLRSRAAAGARRDDRRALGRPRGTACGRRRSARTRIARRSRALAVH